jgi:TPP-dependent pyruvate/acetoin dehydrogenase alpha subunit
VGLISHLGVMIEVMAGVALSFKLRGEDRVALVYSGDGMTSTGAFHEGFNLAAVQRLPLVLVVENNGYAYSTPTSRRPRRRRSWTRPMGTVCAGSGWTATMSWPFTRPRAGRWSTPAPAADPRCWS